MKSYFSFTKKPISVKSKWTKSHKEYNIPYDQLSTFNYKISFHYGDIDRNNKKKFSFANADVNKNVRVCVCVCVCQSLSPSFWDFMDCSPPGSSVHGILQARILEQVAISFSS